MMTETLESPVNLIFYLVSVCRAFRLNGLLKIVEELKLTKEIQPVDILWYIGDLNARGFLKTNVVNYIVDKNEAKRAKQEAKEQEEDITPIRLNELWQDWYQKEFELHFNVDDLAELLFHQAANIKGKEGADSRKIFERLKERVFDHLSTYHHKITERELETSARKVCFQKEDEVPREFEALSRRLKDNNKYEIAEEIKNYVANLHRYINELNRFDEVLQPDDYRDFLQFVHSLKS